jgi:signal transduction histidine kinase
MASFRKHLVLRRVWQELEGTAVRLLPPSEREEPLQRIRAKLGLVSGLLFVAFAAFRALQLFWLGVHGQAVLLVVTASLVLCAPIVARLTESFATVAHYGVALVVVTVTGAAYASGGAASPGLVVFMIVPLFAVFLTGTRGGAVWMIVSVSVIAGFAVLERLGMSPPIRYPVATWNLAKATAAFLLVVVVWVIAQVYERARAEAFARLEKSEAARATHQKELGWLANSLSHEANNTLAYITSDLDFVGGAIDRNDPVLSSALAEARTGADRLRDIVRDVNTIAGQDEPRPPPDITDVGLVLSESVAVARGSGVIVHFDVPKLVAHANVDAHVLERALVNVLMAGGPESILRVALREGLEVEVEAERGAEPRALGIAAARRLVSGMGGRVEFEQRPNGWCAKLALPSLES